MDNENIWDYRTDAFRTTTDFDDLLKSVAIHFKMYSNVVSFVGPWVAKQNETMFIVPERQQIKDLVSMKHPLVSYKTESAITESVINFIETTKGRRALIQPHISSHHSIQLHESLFEISKLENKITLRDDRGLRKPAQVHQIKVYGIDEPIFVENLRIPISQCKYIILRPKLGKHNMPSVNRWEVLIFKKQQPYLINHTDSSLNPRYSGVL